MVLFDGSTSHGRARGKAMNRLISPTASECMPKRIWFARLPGQTRNLSIPLLICDELILVMNLQTGIPFAFRYRLLRYL